LVGGWRQWNTPDGEYANIVMREADSAGAVPMFTYYKLALDFESKNYAVLTTGMHEYLQDMRVLFQKIGAFGKPVMLHIEPDFFGYLQQYCISSKTTPAGMTAKIRYSDIPECQALPETVAGLVECLVAMRNSLAPKLRMGVHASQWGDWYDMNDPSAPAQQKAYSVADFLRSVGSDKLDFLVLETSDRDAGFYEAQGKTKVYWTDADRDAHLKWVGYISERSAKPIIWWQMPFGVPSDVPGTKEHYRDNRVPLFYSMVPRLVELGGFGMLFGAGAEGQTTYDTDGGQYKRFNDTYKTAPVEIK
jgi:hypothetical protein